MLPGRSTHTPERAKIKQSERYTSPKQLSSFLRGGEEESEEEIITRLLENQAMEPTLSLEDQFIGEKGTGILVDFLKKHTHFTSVELRGNSLTPHAFGLICQVLKNCVNLNNLKADWNLIGEGTAGLAALVELAQILPSLHSIDLRNNRIGKGSGPYIAAIIKDSWSLQRFDLRWNDIGDIEARFIIGALRSDPKQLKISLGGNNLGGNKISEPLLFEISKMTHPNQSSVTSISSQGANTPAKHSLATSALGKSTAYSSLGNLKSSQTKSSVSYKKKFADYSGLSENPKGLLNQNPQKSQSFSYENDRHRSPVVEKKLDFSLDEQAPSFQNIQQLVRKQQSELNSPPPKRLKSAGRSPAQQNFSPNNNQSYSPNKNTMNQATQSRPSSAASFGKQGGFVDIQPTNEVRQDYHEQKQERSTSNSPSKRPDNSMQPIRKDDFDRRRGKKPINYLFL